MKPYSIFQSFDISFIRNYFCAGIRQKALVRPPSRTAAAEMHLTHFTHTGLCPTSVVMFLSKCDTRGKNIFRKSDKLKR